MVAVSLRRVRGSHADRAEAVPFEKRQLEIRPAAFGPDRQQHARLVTVLGLALSRPVLDERVRLVGPGCAATRTPAGNNRVQVVLDQHLEPPVDR